MATALGQRRLLFISNLFPDTREPWRGLDNATVLHHLAQRWKIRVLAVRPALPWNWRRYEARATDAPFAPQYVAAAYLPKVGSRFNHRLMTHALRVPLRELQRQFAFDAVLSAWIYPDSCAVAPLAREFNVPFVAVAQGSDVHQYLRHPVRRAVITRTLPEASAIITRSAELGRLLAGVGLDPARLHTIYNGINPACFRLGDRAAARAELLLSAHAPIVLFVGNFYAIKNPLILIEAHARLAARDCRLVMIGSGPLETEARALAARLGTASTVEFRGRLGSDAVARHMQAADALCLPSDNEGVPNVMLEAFACGLPVVASDVGGIAEIHDAEFLGRLVASRDVAALAAALDEVLRQPGDRARIHQHALPFTWQRTSDAYHELLVRAWSGDRGRTQFK